MLELRYGLGGEHPRTLDEVGRTFNVTRERIRQIENQSLKKLQSLAEAMWKGRPVLASRIGGIQDQIEDGRSGVLLDDPTDLAAYGRAPRLVGAEGRPGGFRSREVELAQEFRHRGERT